MGFFKSLKKIFKVAIPTAIAYFTGGPAAAAMTAAQQVSSGALSGSKKTVQSPVTGVTSTVQASDPTSTMTADQAAEEEKKKRLALNAAGISSTSTSPLGVTSGATVTKRNLLGL